MRFGGGHLEVSTWSGVHVRNKRVQDSDTQGCVARAVIA